MHKLEHILLVDDEEDILEVAKACLETVGGYQVTTCMEGTEAIARAQAILPDFILLDVMMPNMDGPSALTVLRAKPTLAHVPIVFMTARVQPAEVTGYLALGATGVISKPFDPMTLSQEVERFWSLFHGSRT